MNEKLNKDNDLYFMRFSSIIEVLFVDFSLILVAILYNKFSFFGAATPFYITLIVAIENYTNFT